jgi:alpha-mannosidase
MLPGWSGSRTLFEVDQPNIILETVKPAEGRTTGQIVLRLYESMGTHTPAIVHTTLPVKAAYQTDMLEQVQSELEVLDGQISLIFTPFKVVTLRLDIDRTQK